MARSDQYLADFDVFFCPTFSCLNLASTVLILALFIVSAVGPCFRKFGGALGLL